MFEGLTSRWTSPASWIASSPCGDLVDQRCRLGRFEAAPGELLPQVEAADEAHRDEQGLALAADRVDRDHVRVVDLRGDPRFALELLAEDLVAGGVGGDHLQGDPPVEGRLGCLVDDAHAAAAQQRPDPVAREQGAFFELSHPGSVAVPSSAGMVAERSPVICPGWDGTRAFPTPASASSGARGRRRGLADPRHLPEALSLPGLPRGDRDRCRPRGRPERPARRRDRPSSLAPSLCRGAADRRAARAGAGAGLRGAPRQARGAGEGEAEAEAEAAPLIAAGRALPACLPTCSSCSAPGPAGG